MSLTPVNNNVRTDLSRMRVDESKSAVDAKPTPASTQAQPDAAVPDAERVQATDAQSQGARQLQQGVGDQLRQNIERLLPGGAGNGSTPEPWLEAGGRRRPPRGGGTVRAQAEPVIKPNPVA